MEQNAALEGGEAGVLDGSEASLRKKFGERGLEEKVAEVQARFSGLLTREGSIRLVALDNGMAPEGKGSAVPVKLGQLKDFEGAFVSVVCRVKKIFCSREFERDGRKGRVCNVLLGDETGEATLVLWNADADFAERALERNSCIRVENSCVKNGELQSSLYTSLSPEKPGPGLPDFSLPPSGVSDAVEGGDFYARVCGKSALREFERNDRNGLVLNLEVEDGSGKPKVLVCWNRNARIAEGLSEGDVVKIEGVTLKNGELHASWMTHMLARPENHPLAEPEFKPLAGLPDGETALVQVVLQKLFEARTSRKCQSCRKPVAAGAEKCGECGGQPRDVFFISAQVRDAGKTSARCVFFGEQAEQLLGMRKTLVSPETMFLLKRDFLEGLSVEMRVQARASSSGDGQELVVKQLQQVHAVRPRAFL